MNTSRLFLLSLVWSILVSTVGLAEERVFHDDFSAYRPGLSPAPAWLTTGDWLIQDGALRGRDLHRSFASLAAAPYGATVDCAVDVTPRTALGKDWKSSGLALVSDLDNYWLLSLTEFPGQAGTKHLIELGEMHAGRWNAQLEGATALVELPSAHHGVWVNGTTYRLQLVTGSDGIRGTVLDAQGGMVWQHAFRFDAAHPAVIGGTPVLWNNAMDTVFDRVEAHVADSIAEPSTALHRKTPLPASLVFDAPLATGDYRLTEDPATYADEHSLPAAWTTSSFFWESHRGAIRCANKTRTWCVPTAAPNGRTVAIETGLLISGASPGGWKNGGIAIIRSPGDYWLLALSEAPEEGKAPPRRMFELGEMLHGVWQAHDKPATSLPQHGPQKNGAWAYGVEYRLRLELTPEAIHATAFSPFGEVVWQAGFAFPADKEAVTSGVPALWDNAFDCTFAHPAMTVRDVLPQPSFAATNGPSAPPQLPPVVAYDAPPMSPLVFPANGFFGLREENGVAWLVDPKGHAYFSVGVEQVKFNGHFSPKVGYSPYNRNVTQLYGSADKWAAETGRRMKDYGFNTAGMMRGPGPARLPGISYTNLVNIGAGFAPFSDLSPITVNGFPNVFHPRWADYCDFKAREFCAPLKDDPWMLGYYVDNELDWHGSNMAAFFIHGSSNKPLEYGLILDILNKPADHAGRVAFLKFLSDRHGPIAELNQAWGKHFTDYEAITAVQVFTLGQPLAASEGDMREFLRIIADRYFGTVCAAILKYDPNHLILGTRFAGWSQDPVWEMCGKYCDVVSVNHYPFADLEAGTVDSAREMLNHVVTLCHKPILLSEWSFLGMDAGLPCRYGAGERFDTQAQRAEAFRIFQSLIFEQPFVIGSDYFMWIDEPATGLSSSSNPEDCSYGIVNEKDEPYPVLTAMAKKINALVISLHQQDVPRLSIDPAKRCVVIENLSPAARDCVIEIWEDGKRREARVHLAERKPASVPLLPSAADGPHQVMVRPVMPGLLSTDRQAAFISASVFVGSAAQAQAYAVVSIANPSGRAVENYLVRLRIADLFPGQGRIACVASYQSGTGVIPQQLEPADDGTGNLVLLVDRIESRAARFLRVAPAPQQKFLAPSPVALPFAHSNGLLSFSTAAGSPRLLDHVAFNGVELGMMEAMIWQRTPQNLWLKPNRPMAMTMITGPALTTIDCAVEFDSGALSNAVAEVDGAGKPLATANGTPGSYRATYRIRIPTGSPYYLMELRSCTNTATFPWKLDNYYHHMPSAIGGDVRGDLPQVSTMVTEYYSSLLAWYDAEVGVGYGALRTRSMYGSNFYLDPAGRQHADLARAVRITLAPGETWTAQHEPEVPIFACRGKPEERPWQQATDDLNIRAAVVITVVAPSR